MVIQIQKLLLILVRIASFISFCPGISYGVLPAIFKVGFSLTLSYIVYMSTGDIEIIEKFTYFFLLLGKEVIVGMTFGYITKLVFGIIEIAGQLVDFQSGFSMGNMFDPAMGTQASYYGRIYYWIGLSLFFILNIHHKMIEAILKSFVIIPITKANIFNFNLVGILAVFSKVFELALYLAAPMIILVLATDIVLGIISKSVPQINVLMLGMPLKALVGYLMTFIMISTLIKNIADNIYLLSEYIDKFSNIFI